MRSVLGTNPTAHDDGFLRGKRYLIVDQDSKFTVEFGHILQQAGVQVVRTSEPRSRRRP